MAHVFIAYSRADKAFADDLRKRLREAEIATWKDEDIPPAEDWTIEIDTKIQESFALIVILSPDAIKSEYVSYEWAYALGANKTVLPIHFRKCEQIPFRLQTKQWIDFTQEYKWDVLITKLGLEQQKAKAQEYTIPQPIQKAAEQLNDLDKNKRIQAVEALANMLPHNDALDTLEHALLTNLMSDVCEKILRLLSKVYDYGHHDNIEQAIYDDRKYVRFEAFIAYYRITMGISKAFFEYYGSLPFSSSDQHIIFNNEIREFLGWYITIYSTEEYELSRFLGELHREYSKHIAVDTIITIADKIRNNVKTGKLYK